MKNIHFYFLVCTFLWGTLASGLDLIRIPDADSDNLVSKAFPSSSTALPFGSSFHKEGCECTCTGQCTSHDECTCDCSCPEDHLPVDMLPPLQHDSVQARREQRTIIERQLVETVSLPPCPPGGRIDKFVLFDAKTGNSLRTIKAGDVICRPKHKINVQAVVEECCDNVESVEFIGNVDTQVENVKRYFVFGDVPRGEIYGKKLRLGKLVYFKATPWSKDDAKGTMGTPSTIFFKFIDCDHRNLRGTDVKASGESADDDKAAFDFLYAGFPETSLDSLPRPKEVALASQCGLVNGTLPPRQSHALLDWTLQELASVTPNAKHGMYCPGTLTNHGNIATLSRHSPQAKLVVGVWHPLKLAEAILVGHSRGDPVDVHQVASLAERVRIDLLLAQLGKADVSPDLMSELSVSRYYDLAIHPNRFKVFLFERDQLQDDNVQRKLVLDDALVSFLEVQSHNSTHFINWQNRNFSENPIDWCDPKYDELRDRILKPIPRMVAWFRTFVDSEDVVVANKDHLISLLLGWTVDPCTGPVSLTD